MCVCVCVYVCVCINICIYIYAFVWMIYVSLLTACFMHVIVLKTIVVSCCTDVQY